ncbi:MAG: deaminase [Candidatus Saccharimonadales bacterium]
MRRVEGDEFQSIKPFFEAAADVAESATCLRAKCGSVIVKNSVIIGRGFNSPALDDESQRLCEAEMNTVEKPKYDKTCCIHAEWRAVIDACKTNADKLAGSVLYFMRIDSSGSFTDAGDPFCTVCSRLTMEAGVEEFALYNDNGADIYQLGEYNIKSYEAYIK